MGECVHFLMSSYLKICDVSDSRLGDVKLWPLYPELNNEYFKLVTINKLWFIAFTLAVRIL